MSAGIRYIVLRLRRARNPDMVAVEHLERFLREAARLGVTVLLAGVRPEFAKVLDNVQFKNWLPQDRIFPEEHEIYTATLRAVRYAYQLLREAGGKDGIRPEGARPPGRGEAVEPDYYLV